MAGKLIVLEGMDGAGTTTQSRLLVSHLESLGLSVVQSAEPTASALGLECRRMLAMPIESEQNLLVSLALCFAADRMQHVHGTIIPALKSKDFVILDRYVLSSLVYQGLHLPTSFVKEINRYAVKPDITIVLDIDAKLAAERLGARASQQDFYEAPSLLTKMRSRYLHFAEDDPAHTVLVDAQGSVEQVRSHIIHVLEERFLRVS